MFLAAGGASQILWGTIDLNDTTRAIYRWQYRVVGPGSAIHTLGVGVDTFAVRRVGNRVILGRYWPVGFDNPDSMFVADTAELRGGAFILTKRLNLEHAVETRRLRFTPGKN